MLTVELRVELNNFTLNLSYSTDMIFPIFIFVASLLLYLPDKIAHQIILLSKSIKIGKEFIYDIVKMMNVSSVDDFAIQVFLLHFPAYRKDAVIINEKYWFLFMLRLFWFPTKDNHIECRVC